MSLSEQAVKAVSEMTPEQIKAEYEKLKAQSAKRVEYSKKYNASEEVKEKRKAYSEEYRQRDPEGFAAKRKAYNERPEVKAKRQSYMKARYEKNKALLARAKEMGDRKSVV